MLGDYSQLCLNGHLYKTDTTTDTKILVRKTNLVSYELVKRIEKRSKRFPSRDHLSIVIIFLLMMKRKLRTTKQQFDPPAAMNASD